jgi:hypothetical protein
MPAELREALLPPVREGLSGLGFPDGGFMGLKVDEP